MQYAAGWEQPWKASWALGMVQTHLDAVNDAGETALVIAAKCSNLRVISLLCNIYNYRYRPDVAFDPHNTKDRAREISHVLNIRDSKGRTALSHSCSGSYETISIIRKLLDAVGTTLFFVEHRENILLPFDNINSEQ